VILRLVALAGVIVVAGCASYQPPTEVVWAFTGAVNRQVAAYGFAEPWFKYFIFAPSESGCETARKKPTEPHQRDSACAEARIVPGLVSNPQYYGSGWRGEGYGVTDRDVCERFSTAFTTLTAVGSLPRCAPVSLLWMPMRR
jgi:hypothetical protein